MFPCNKGILPKWTSFYYIYNFWNTHIHLYTEIYFSFLKDPKIIYYNQKYIFNHWDSYLPSLTMLSHHFQCYILISIFYPLSIFSLSQFTTLTSFLSQPTTHLHTVTLCLSIKIQEEVVSSPCPIPSEWQPSPPGHCPQPLNHPTPILMACPIYWAVDQAFILPVQFIFYHPYFFK